MAIPHLHIIFNEDGTYEFQSETSLKITVEDHGYCEGGCDAPEAEDSDCKPSHKTTIIVR